MSIKTNQLVRALSIALSALSCVCTFMILPMYILGATSEQKNLPHLIWPPFLSLPHINNHALLYMRPRYLRTC